MPKPSERLLELYPDLKFDRTIALKILEKSFIFAFERFLKMPFKNSLKELLACFGHDTSAEEFLCHYILAITGKRMHYQVY